MERQEEKATCLLCRGESEINIILSTGKIVKTFGLCLACRDNSISDIIEELSFQDVQSSGDDIG